MWLINPDGNNNNIQNEFKYLLHLEGFGYLCNNTGWEDDLNMGHFLTTNHFLHEGDTAHFDEIPDELFHRTSPLIGAGLKVIRKFSSHTFEEMVFVA